MAWYRKLLFPASLLVLLCQRSLAEHPCSDEVASACADRPGTDIGACLKDPEEHDNPTEISSACTDFIALNKACVDDIEEHCDAEHFADDTIPCLVQRTERDDLSERCQGVISWAVPEEATDDAEEQVVTDELGLSEKDYAEKKEWQAKRREARGDAIERMKMKEQDRKKEEDRAALEEFKKNDPEGYAQMIQTQEEEARQQAEFKKKERARAAAIERAKRKAAGLSEDGEEEDASSSSSKKGQGKEKKKKTSWTVMAANTLLIVAILCVGYFMVTKLSKSKGGGRNANKANKKKRG